VLLRVDMPGLLFDRLDLHFDPGSALLSYRPEVLDDLIAWNDLEPDDSEVLAPHALHDLFLLCYAHWRHTENLGNGHMEAALAATVPIRVDPRLPLRQTYLQRASLAVQAWLGLLEFYEDFEAI
jgi:hypothetical protein